PLARGLRQDRSGAEQDARTQGEDARIRWRREVRSRRAASLWGDFAHVQEARRPGGRGDRVGEVEVRIPPERRREVRRLRADAAAAGLTRQTEEDVRHAPGRHGVRPRNETMSAGPVPVNPAAPPPPRAAGSAPATWR